MTRINVLPPQRLTDEFLMAEYRELPRVFTLAAHLLTTGTLATRTLPTAYTLGKGHMLFFVTRLGWLGRRHADLTRELLARGYRLTFRDPLPTDGGDYTPDDTARMINLVRLRERIHGVKRPLHYWGKPVPPTFYDSPQDGSHDSV